MRIGGDYKVILHNKEFCIVHFSPNIIRVIKSRTFGRHDMRHALQKLKNLHIVFGKPEKRELLQRLRHRQKHNYVNIYIYKYIYIMNHVTFQNMYI